MVFTSKINNSKKTCVSRISKPSIVLPKLLVKPVGRAMNDFKMIKKSDQVLLAVSAGKDSLSLFDIFLYFLASAPIHFELGVVTIDPQVDVFEPQTLDSFLKNLTRRIFFEVFPIMQQSKA